MSELHHTAPAILNRGVLTGGAACGLYRNLLIDIQGEFRLPSFNGYYGSPFLCDGMEFTSFTQSDAEALLKGTIVSTSVDGAFLHSTGVTLAFAEAAITFEPETAWNEAWVASFRNRSTQIAFRVLDPVSLYREKRALSMSRGYRTDLIQCAAVANYLCLELSMALISLFDGPSFWQKTEASNFLHAIGRQAPEIASDRRIKRRIEELRANFSPALTPEEQSLMSQFAAETRAIFSPETA